MKKILYSILTLTLGLVLSGSSCTPQDAPKVPKISNLTATGITATAVDFVFDLDTDAVVYVLIKPYADAVPNTTEIKTSVFSASYNCTAGTGITGFYQSGYTPNTKYTCYIIAENANGISSIVTVTFTTNP
jgi:hypothetical protein